MPWERGCVTGAGCFTGIALVRPLLEVVQLTINIGNTIIPPNKYFICLFFCFIALCNAVISTITTFPSNIVARLVLVTRHVTEYSQLKLGNVRVLFPNFQSRACCEKYSKDNKHNNLHLARKYARIFVLGQIELRSRKTVRFSYNFHGIFPRQMEAIVYVYSTVHCSTRMGLSEYRICIS